MSSIIITCFRNWQLLILNSIEPVSQFGELATTQCHSATAEAIIFKSKDMAMSMSWNRDDFQMHELAIMVMAI